jgi:hypothetical protein
MKPPFDFDAADKKTRMLKNRAREYLKSFCTMHDSCGARQAIRYERLSAELDDTTSDAFIVMLSVLAAEYDLAAGHPGDPT